MAGMEIKIEVTPEIREAIDVIKPVTEAAVAYVDDPTPEKFAALEATVKRFKQFRRESKGLKVVE